MFWLVRPCMRRRHRYALISRAALSTAVHFERLETRQLFCDFGAEGLRVNAGGGEYLDSTQFDWQADNGFTGGVVSAAPFNVDGTADARCIRPADGAGLISSPRPTTAHTR